MSARRHAEVLIKFLLDHVLTSSCLAACAVEKDRECALQARRMVPSFRFSMQFLSLLCATSGQQLKSDLVGCAGGESSICCLPSLWRACMLQVTIWQTFVKHQRTKESISISRGSNKYPVLCRPEV